MNIRPSTAHAQSAALPVPFGMALIPAGTFTMGDPLDGERDAIPTNVTVSAFYMDVNLVSYSQWQSVYNWAANHGYGFAHPGSGKAPNHPVQSVDWYDAVKWCNARSQQDGKSPVYFTDEALTQVYTNGDVAPYVNWATNGYRLPTEAEWEKAARGGLRGQRFPWGNVITRKLANYYGDIRSFNFDLGPDGYNPTFTNGPSPDTNPVGYFLPNGYGLYDMAGNVFQWCWDWFKSPYVGGTDPRGSGRGSVVAMAQIGSNHVLRGGSWTFYAFYARCAYRHYGNPAFADHNFGFRCVSGG